jgi:hypothetical protein
LALRDVIVHGTGGATAVDWTAAMFLDGGDVPIMIMGEIPNLMCCDYGIYDIHTAGTSFSILAGARWQALPPTWPSTAQLGDLADLISGTMETEAIEVNWHNKPQLIVAQDINMADVQRAMGPNTTWVNAGDSIFHAPENGAEVSLVMHNQYKGPGIFPYRGGKLQHIRLQATGATIAAANVWDNTNTEKLTDNTPALDPDRIYRLHKMSAVGEGTTQADYNMGVRFSVVGMDQWHAIALGSGQVESGLPLETVFLEDSVPPFQGNRTIKIDVIAGGATDDHQVDLWLEDYTAFAAGTGGGPGFGSFGAPGAGAQVGGGNPLAAIAQAFGVAAPNVGSTGFTGQIGAGGPLPGTGGRSGPGGRPRLM